jgi:dihydrofolate reductase
MKVTLIIASSADGFIARNSEHIVDWTDIEDKGFFQEMTESIGTVIAGYNTYRSLRAALPGRRMIVMSSSADVADSKPGELEFFSGMPEELMKQLEGEGIDHAALIGGGQLDGSFLSLGLVDEIYLTIAPLLFGQGISLSSDFDLETKLTLVDHRQIGEGSVLLHYEVVK